MKKLLYILLFISLTCHLYAQGNERFESFTKVKKILLEEIYLDYNQTFYCSSDFDSSKNIVHDEGYIPISDNKRGRRLEWEHVVPANVFWKKLEGASGHSQCISSSGKQYKGRKCVEKVSKLFRFIQADMHNLKPAIGQLNGIRSDFPYGILQGEERRFGSCDVEVHEKQFEPKPSIRGDIARIYFYMNYQYPGYQVIDDLHFQLFLYWNIIDPVDDIECKLSKRIEIIQGNENPFVKYQCILNNKWE